MKVLQIRSAFEDSGPGSQSRTIAVELRSRGHDVSFACAGGELLSEIQRSGFKTYFLRGLALDRRNPVSAAATVLQLARLLRDQSFDAIHSHNAASTYLSFFAMKLARVRPTLVRSVRGVEVRETHQWRNLLYRTYPAHMLAVSEFTRSELLRLGARAGKITVTYNGVDLTRFDPSSVDAQVVRARHSIGDGLIVGHIGAFSGWKGQEVLVKAFASLLAVKPDSWLVYVGDGPSRAAVESEAQSLGVTDRVRFAGFRTDAELYHAAFDIYCQPSTRGEMLPNSILEAMAMRKPWVGSDISGLGEMTASGAAGLLCPPGDAKSLATNLIRLAQDSTLRERMGAAARLEVERKFTIQSVVDVIERAYLRGGASS